jgi:hypothetical protein
MNMLKFEELRSFLDEKADQYNAPDFIENDPIQIPHRFSVKQDIEIAGFWQQPFRGETENQSLNLRKKCLISWGILLMILY